VVGLQKYYTMCNYFGLAKKFVRLFRVEWNTIYILQN